MNLLLEECNTPEIKELVKKYLDKVKKANAYFAQPTGDISLRLTLPSWNDFRGPLSLQIPEIPQILFCYAHVEAFTNNCGMRMITGVQSRIVPELEKLWVTIVESAIAKAGYSVVVGSDGAQGGYAIKSTLERSNRGWEFVKLCQNRRTTIGDILYLHYKCIPASVAEEIKWENAKSVA